MGFAVELEKRYKGIRAPHKFKGGVSGCIQECAEAQGKDFGVVATPKGWNVYIGGNGGAKPRHADVLAENVTKAMAVKLLDRFIILYTWSADRLSRTARWIKSFPGGMQELRQVLVKDELGICQELEQEMDELVGKFHCEWTELVKNPEHKKIPTIRQHRRDPGGLGEDCSTIAVAACGLATGGVGPQVRLHEHCSDG